MVTRFVIEAESWQYSFRYQKNPLSFLALVPCLLPALYTLIPYAKTYKFYDLMYSLTGDSF